MCILCNYYTLLYVYSNNSIFLIDSILIIVIMRYCKSLKYIDFREGSREGPGRFRGGPGGAGGPQEVLRVSPEGAQGAPSGPLGGTWEGPGRSG